MFSFMLNRREAAVVLLLLAGCSRPGYAVSDSRIASDCELWTDAHMVVAARVVDFGTTRTITLGGAENYPVAPMTIDVQTSYKGAATERLSVLMGHGIAVNGDSEQGNMKNAEGLFWLRLVDGQLVFAGQYFSRSVEGGYLRSTTSTPSDGILSPEGVRALAASCKG